MTAGSYTRIIIITIIVLSVVCSEPSRSGNSYISFYSVFANYNSTDTVVYTEYYVNEIVNIRQATRKGVVHWSWPPENLTL